MQLLDLGADIDPVNKIEQIPMDIAYIKDSLTIANALLKANAIINVTDADGVTPPHMAASSCGETRAYRRRKALPHIRDTYDLLLEEGADSTTRNSEGQTAPELLKAPIEECVEYL